MKKIHPDQIRVCKMIKVLSDSPELDLPTEGITQKDAFIKANESQQLLLIAKGSSRGGGSHHGSDHRSGGRERSSSSESRGSSNRSEKGSSGESRRESSRSEGSKGSSWSDRIHRSSERTEKSSGESRREFSKPDRSSFGGDRRHRVVERERKTFGEPRRESVRLESHRDSSHGSRGQELFKSEAKRGSSWGDRNQRGVEKERRFSSGPMKMFIRPEKVSERGNRSHRAVETKHSFQSQNKSQAVQRDRQYHGGIEKESRFFTIEREKPFKAEVKKASTSKESSLSLKNKIREIVNQSQQKLVRQKENNGAKNNPRALTIRPRPCEPYCPKPHPVPPCVLCPCPPPPPPRCEMVDCAEGSKHPCCGGDVFESVQTKADKSESSVNVEAREKSSGVKDKFRNQDVRTKSDPVRRKGSSLDNEFKKIFMGLTRDEVKGKTTADKPHLSAGKFLDGGGGETPTVGEKVKEVKEKIEVKVNETKEKIQKDFKRVDEGLKAAGAKLREKVEVKSVKIDLGPVEVEFGPKESGGYNPSGGSNPKENGK